MGRVSGFCLVWFGFASILPLAPLALFHTSHPPTPITSLPWVLQEAPSNLPMWRRKNTQFFKIKMSVWGILKANNVNKLILEALKDKIAFKGWRKLTIAYPRKEERGPRTDWVWKWQTPWRDQLTTWRDSQAGRGREWNKRFQDRAAFSCHLLICLSLRVGEVGACQWFSLSVNFASCIWREELDTAWGKGFFFSCAAKAS